MARKTFSFARAENMDGKARLTWFMSTPFFVEKGQELGEMTVRILRSREDGCVWGQDYNEYFHGLRPDHAECIFEGALPAINHRKFEYVDESVELRTTYAYWIASETDETPTGPLPVRIVDHEVWWPIRRIEERMTLLADMWPERVTMKQYGTTSRARPLYGLTVGNPDRVVALVGTIHAGESGPELILPALERLLRDDGALLDRAGVAAMPSVNYEERERIVDGVPWYLRTNPNRVDLNRNFDADWEMVEYGYGMVSSDPDSLTWRGPSPGSEPETQAVVNFLSETRPKAVFAYHCLASITGACFLTPRAAEADEAFAKACARAAAPYARGFFGQDDVTPSVVFGCSAGSLPTWCYRRLGVPGMDLERSSEDPIELAALHDQATPQMLAEYQERHYRGVRAVVRTLVEGRASID